MTTEQTPESKQLDSDVEQLCEWMGQHEKIAELVQWLEGISPNRARDFIAAALDVWAYGRKPLVAKYKADTTELRRLVEGMRDHARGTHKLIEDMDAVRLTMDAEVRCIDRMVMRNAKRLGLKFLDGQSLLSRMDALFVGLIGEARPDD